MEVAIFVVRISYNTEIFLELLIIPTSLTSSFIENQEFFIKTIKRGKMKKRVSIKILKNLWELETNNLKLWRTNIKGVGKNVYWYPLLFHCRGDLGMMKKTLEFLYNNSYPILEGTISIGEGYKLKI